MIPLLRACRAELGPLISLAVPLVSGLTAAAILPTVDTAMLGPFGEIPLAALSLTYSVLVIFYAGLYGFMQPVGVLVGLAHGARDAARVADVVHHGLWLGAAAGMVCAALMAGLLWLLPYLGQPPQVVAVLGPYWLCVAASLIPFGMRLAYKQALDSIDRPWAGVALLLVALAVHIALNWMLIEGWLGFPALGLAGVGIATLLGDLACLAATAAFWRRGRWMGAYRIAAPWRSASARSHLREGTPMGIQYALEAGAFAATGIMIGWLGATALAANQIVFSVASLLFMLPLGLAGATAIRIAQAAGEDAHARIGPIGFAANGVVTAWMIAFTVLLTAAGAPIARLFVDDPAIVALAAVMFAVVGAMQVFDGVQSVSLGALRGLLDSRWPTRVSLIAYWLIALPAGWLLAFPLGYGAPGLWAGFGIGLAVAAVALFRRFAHKTGAVARRGAQV
jgi:multidrug resistance protein, MATE family